MDGGPQPGGLLFVFLRLDLLLLLHGRLCGHLPFIEGTYRHVERVLTGPPARQIEPLLRHHKERRAGTLIGREAGEPEALEAATRNSSERSGID
jgi:hypothetical protein